MKHIHRFLTVLVLLGFVLSKVALPAHAVAPWNTTGAYEITFFLTGDPTAYIHEAALTQTGTSIDGTGKYPAGGPYTYTWDITSGSISGDTINLTVNYLTGAVGTTMTMTGTVAPNGAVSGTWSDNFGGGTRTGTWSISDGVSVPAIHTPAHGATVTQSAMTEVDWTDSVGANAPFEYWYEAYPTAGYNTAPLFSSGWISASEIPTPGTAPGNYYLRVRAKNDIGIETAWSNDASNPYLITVTEDPINPFPVPAQCDQETAYNLIEGTSGSEVLMGTSGPDLILAKEGSDSVHGLGGNDCIVGDAGSDALRGGTGDDVILGGSESDSLMGENGEDTLYGEAGSDSLMGGNSADSLYGGAGSDSLRGENGSDTLDGEAGVDAAHGGAATDTCTAEAETACEA